MPSLTIKRVPDDLLQRLRRQAERHRRSLNGEVLHLLERAVAGAAADPERTIQRIRKLQERTQLPPLDERLLEQATEQDRP